MALELIRKHEVQTLFEKQVLHLQKEEELEMHRGPPRSFYYPPDEHVLSKS